MKFAKQLKPFLGGILLAIVFLFTQAFADLNLPNYMSEIVNVGIQQSGIEHAAPDALSEDGMRLATTLMTDEEQRLVEANYAPVSATDKNTEGELYGSLYPAAADPQYYIKKTNDGGKPSADSEALDDAFGAASLTLVHLMTEMAPDMQPPTGDAEAASQAEQATNIDVTKLYPMIPMLHSLPESAIQEARQLAATDPMMQKQTGILFTKAFYNELGVDLGAKQTSYILKVGLKMLGIALLGGLATVIVGFLASRTATGVARNLRTQIFAKVEDFSKREFDQFSTASLITRCTNDVNQVQQVLLIGIRMMCYAPILGIGGIIMAVNKSASMSWIIALAVVILLGMIIVVMTIAMPKFKLIQKLMDKLNLVSRENLNGLMVIRSVGAQRHETERFEQTNTDLTQTNLFVNRVMVFMFPTMMFIMNAVTLLIVWVGAQRIAASSMQVGDMMAFMQYVMQILMSFMMVSMMFIMVPRAAVSAGRITEVLETEIAISDPVEPQSFDPQKRGVLEFKDVYFRYEGAEEDALRAISFVAKPGQTTAIIGSTGSGKSTIANLALRFYDVSAGEIQLDGVDIRHVKLGDLRAKIGYAPQQGLLLSGTIASNVIYGKPDATEEEMKWAAEVAQATEFISEKPEQFEAPISQGGSNVSGGQKQRLTIARALAKRPDALIFDDSFSALDFRTDARLRQALKEQTANATMIIVAQRVSTIMHAEQILVLEKGEIVGRGTHRELLQQCPEYREIASSQLSKEELA
ncbi:ABC transporter [Ammoniphilus oxalaticus]|uniref:ABC transporter n=1 Tax=Ammoniphilus oxalaticus TaxID=66863 RepID=A0A419SH97_9BACL|nr:ABC transporter ATP-binding protein [Ammoniphilus oxalaticus]RKD23143.1 ABC transporter [Ammoniphilus oxalaticus]